VSEQVWSCVVWRVVCRVPRRERVRGVPPGKGQLDDVIGEEANVRGNEPQDLKGE
jgi:hypothetical protein